nr:ATPase, F1/V1/A1 complex, alpha/beta subunit, zinc knuckle CX2CX4HX4C [Tanacetum cinerariifolium]
KKNSDVFGNGTEKYKELTGSEGLDRDDCVLINDERDKSDARCKDVLENIAGMDGITGIEEIAEMVQSGSNLVNELANDEIAESSIMIKENLMVNKWKTVKRSERWNLTLCGHFVRFDMNIHDHRQHVFKFRDSNGLNAVLDKGLWMVKIINVPLEAWSVEGINAIASSLGNPMMMDTNIAAICHKGIGNFDFARILMEMDAEKELKKEIVIQYKDKNNNVRGNKEAQIKGKHLEVGKQMYQGFRSNTNIENLNKEGNGNKVNHSKWNVKEKHVEEIRNTANKFFVLNSLPKDNDQEIRTLKERMIVDDFLNQKLHPTLIDLMTWSK